MRLLFCLVLCTVDFNDVWCDSNDPYSFTFNRYFLPPVIRLNVSTTIISFSHNSLFRSIFMVKVWWNWIFKSTSPVVSKTPEIPAVDSSKAARDGQDCWHPVWLRWGCLPLDCWTVRQGEKGLWEVSDLNARSCAVYMMTLMQSNVFVCPYPSLG